MILQITHPLMNDSNDEDQIELGCNDNCCKKVNVLKHNNKKKY